MHEWTDKQMEKRMNEVRKYKYFFHTYLNLGNTSTFSCFFYFFKQRRNSETPTLLPAFELLTIPPHSVSIKKLSSVTSLISGSLLSYTMLRSTVQAGRLPQRQVLLSVAAVNIRGVKTN